MNDPRDIGMIAESEERPWRDDRGGTTVWHLKAKMAVAAIGGERTLSELAQQFDVNLNTDIIRAALGAGGLAPAPDGDLANSLRSSPPTVARCPAVSGPDN